MDKIIGFFTANPLIAMLGSAVAGIFFWKIINAIYFAVMPLKQMAFFLAGPVFDAAQKCGAREDKISDPVLKVSVKKDTKNVGDFLDAIWDAGIDLAPMPDKAALWDSISKKAA